MTPQLHHCKSCRKYVDPAADGAAENFSALNLIPFCGVGSVWFMDTRPDWSCALAGTQNRVSLTESLFDLPP